MEEFIFTYKHKGSVWRSEGPGGWHFVSMPKKISKEIRTLHGEIEEGWGRLKAELQINNSLWKTSIWFDTKLNCYLVPINSKIRKKENIVEGSTPLLEIKIYR